MTKSIVNFSVLGLLLFFIFSLSSFGQEAGFGITTQSVVNLKITSSYSSEMNSQALMGTPVQILETVNGWCHLTTPDGYKSWATEVSIKKLNNVDFEVWKAAPKIIVISYFSIIRSKPSEDSEVISDAIYGNIIQYEGEIKNYFKVTLPDGRTGYLRKINAMVFKQWLTSRNYSAKNIIKTANYFVGFPYLWGGTSIKGMDCSGFTKTCFFLNGVILPRDASQQAKTGENIDISQNLNNLQPADLLFFGSVIDGKESIVHVAIYIGKGEFIHSLGMVRIGSLFSENKNYDAYNHKRLIKAQRILTHIDKDANIVSIRKHPLYQL